MADVKVNLENVEPGDDDEYVIGANIVTRIEVDPMEGHYVLLTLHYYETLDAQEQNQ